jgi:fatty acid desaturase
MRWPELLFLLFVLVSVVALLAFGWGVLVLLILAWLLGISLVAAIKYEAWRARDFYVNGTWQNVELQPAKEGDTALLNLRLKHYVQVGLTAEQARQLRDRLDAALQFSDGEAMREAQHP